MKLYLKEPLTVGFLDGRTMRPDCAEKRTLAGGEEFLYEMREGGYLIRVRDRVIRTGRGEISFIRRVEGICHEKSARGTDAAGISIGAEWSVKDAGKGPWRFAVPSIRYTQATEADEDLQATFMEDRLSAGLVAAYHVREKRAYTLSKVSVSQRTERAMRKRGDSRYLHRTQNTSLGYRKEACGKVDLCIRWPYEEADKSVALNAGETPVYAYYPLDGRDFQEEFEYILKEEKVPSYTDGVYNAFVRLAGELQKRGERVAELPFTREESMEYRTDSLGKSYREFDGDGAGFFFHFDPRKGYGSLPSGFGASFSTIPHDSYPHILEYGFTGRQLNAALMMAKNRGGEWVERGAGVMDFFLQNCTAQNGWLYSLYDLNTKAPFYSFGDEDAPKLHYVSRTKDKGNYLRTMTEPINDVLEAYIWYKNRGFDVERWLRAVIRYADFLTQVQNPDGSWARAYKPDKSPASLGTKGSVESATAVPLVFLCSLCRELEKGGDCSGDKSRAGGGERAQREIQAGKYRQAAVRAGDYVLKNFTARQYYEGGTLDNPNIVDKEAAQYAMAGLYHLYSLTGDRKYLDGAVLAGKLFITWNYIWNAPVEEDTFLGEKHFKTKGLGAINSIWGGGVVDIYSLFHIRELYLTGREAKEPFFCRMAEWISAGTAQILSSPADGMGFADSGMQPEGFGICCQGADEGMIQKGDIWGTLGWIYSAGIYGLGRYLEAVKQWEPEDWQNGARTAEDKGM